MNLALTGSLDTLPAEQRDAKIMVLCDRAMTNLREARSIEAVTAIRNAADAFAHYARKMKAAVEAKNECELVVLLAEARIGAELKAAQERGEINQHGGDRSKVLSGNLAPATLPEIGLTRKQAMEAKRLAAAGEPAIRAEVKAATTEGRRPSRNRLMERIPAIGQRPPEFTQFVLWLRTGADLMTRLGPADTFNERLAGHGLAVPNDHLAGVGAFLRAMEEANAEG